MLGYPGGLDIIIRVLVRGRQRGENQNINPDRRMSSSTTTNPSSWVLTNNNIPECSWGNNFFKFLVMFIV